MLVKFSQQVDLPARLAEKRIAEYFDLDRNQVRCRYVNHKMPSAPGEKVLEVTVSEPFISNNDMLIALGIVQESMHESTLQSSEHVSVRTSTRKEKAMAENKETQLVEDMNAGNASASEATLIETFKKIFFNDVIAWAKQQIINALAKVQKLVSDYEIKVKEQDKKISDLIDAKNKAEENAVQIKASEDTRYKQLLDRVAKLEAKIAAAGNAQEVVAKAMKG